MRPAKLPAGYNRNTIIRAPLILVIVIWGTIFGFAATYLATSSFGVQNITEIEIVTAVFAAVLTILAPIVWRSWKLSRRLKQHLKHVTLESVLPLRLHTSIYKSYQGKYEQRIDTQLMQGGPAWNLYDFIIDRYSTTKYGTHNVTRKIHTVIEMQLQRKVPNIVFDNRQAHGRQLQRMFLHGQQLSFEGNFDAHYDSYAPEGFHIDAFSFISPEVLDAMVRFSLPADIELMGDRLICTAPILPYDKFEEFKQECFNLYQHLNDNLDTYRDNSLKGEARKTDVNAFATELLRNPWANWPWLLLSGAAFFGLIIFQLFHIWYSGPLSQLIFYAGIIFGGHVVWSYKQYTHNRRAKHLFELGQLYTPKPKVPDRLSLYRQAVAFNRKNQQK